jgi:hypothetical protein
MIVLTKGQPSTIIFCTPAENSNIVYQNYCFKFTNRSTQSVIEDNYSNQSATSRYQMFDFNASAFDNEDEGLWTYEIRGCDAQFQPIDPILESGYMYLKPSDNFEPTKYDEQINTFKTYNG